MAFTRIRVVVALMFSLIAAGCASGGAGAPRTVAAAGSDKPYFVEFRSRFALSYGHSFVVFGRMDRNGRVLQQEVAGLAPASADPNVYVAGHVVPVPSSTGATDGDLEKEYMTAYWRVRVSEPEYRKVVSRIRELQAKHTTWTAVGYNCNAFVGDVAASMGYSKPFHLLRPRSYIDSLRRQNQKAGDAGWTNPKDEAPGAKGRTV